MNDKHETPLIRATRTLLRPLIRLLLRGGIPVQMFYELAKEVYVDVAMQEFDLPGKKQTNSRVSILTGLSRKEVQRLVNTPATDETDMLQSQHRAASVISGWVRDREFLQNDNEPGILEIEGESGSFAQLVKKYSGDMPVRAMLDELIRVGVVKKLDNNRVQLLSRSYVPLKGNPEKMLMLGTDVADLITTIDHNILEEQPEPRFQRKVMYDNVPVEATNEFRAFSREYSQQLIEKFDQWLASHDRDTNPDVAGQGRMRTGIGIYYFEEKLPEEVQHENAS